MPKLPAAPAVPLVGLDSLVARHPAMPYKGDNPIALDPLASQFHGKRQDIQNPQTPPTTQQQEVIGIIPTMYTIDGPAAGTVVGIVLGSVLGFLLLIWLFWSIANTNNGNGTSNAIAGEEEIVVRRPRHSHSGRSGRSRRSTHTDVREISRSPRRRSQIIVEERRPPRTPRARSIVVDDHRSRSRVPGDDVVEVFEEHDDYRERRGTRRY